MSNNQATDTGFRQGNFTFQVGSRNIMFSTRTALIIIMSLAVVLRVFSAVYQGNNVSDLPGIFDQISYDGLAQRLVNGNGFSFAEGHWPATRAEEPTAHWSYFYTLYLAAIYKLFGHYPLIARLIQALVAGVLQTFLLWRIGTRLFNRTVGLVAALWNAVYIYFFYYAGALITETLYITGILWMFDCALRLVSSQSEKPAKESIKWWRWIELGLAIGMTVLLRQAFLIFLPFFYLWLWWNLRREESGRWYKRLRWSALKGLSLATLVLILMILPWTIRNQRAFGTFVLLNTNAGFAFFWGNHPIYGTNFISLLPTQKSYYDLIPPELRSLNEAELDKALLSKGIQFIADDPQRFLLLSISRIREFIKFWPSSDSSMISNISRVGSFGVALPFMLLGLWFGLTSEFKTSSPIQKSGIVLILMFVVIYSGIHLASWTLIRYRLPMDALLLIFAALGVVKLVGKRFLVVEVTPSHV